MNYNNRFPEGNSQNKEIEDMLVYLNELRGQLNTLEAEIKRIVNEAVGSHVTAYHSGGGS